jgi:hypothetical protein
VIAAQRRVLRLLDSHLATLPADTLVATDTGGLFTRADLRHHIASALALRVRP